MIMGVDNNLTVSFRFDSIIMLITDSIKNPESPRISRAFLLSKNLL